MTGVPDLRQTAGEDRKESSIRGGGTRKQQSRIRGGHQAFSSNARRKGQYQANERQSRGARARYRDKRCMVWLTRTRRTFQVSGIEMQEAEEIVGARNISEKKRRNQVINAERGQASCSMANLNSTNVLGLWHKNSRDG